MKYFSVTTIVLALLLVAQSAFAFDGYKDRRGPFFGVTAGAGIGASNVDEPSDITGLEDERAVGLQASVLVGGGATQDLVFWAEGSTWIRTVRINDLKLKHQHFNLIPTASYFVFDGLHPFLGFGLAYAAFNTQRNDDTFLYREFGFAAKGGVGYEMFINGTVAIGAQLHYTRHFYGVASFDTFGGGLTVRWY